MATREPILKPRSSRGDEAQTVRESETPHVGCYSFEKTSRKKVFPVRDYDLAATLESGQAFRWRRVETPAGRVIPRPPSPVGRVTPCAPSSFQTTAGRGLPALPEVCWDGVIASRWVRLRQTRSGIAAEVAAPVADWRWLENYLQTELDFAAVLKTFPDDAPMRSAVAACRGLRLLRQEPWECLASFILSSTKQIVQIRQIVELLCERFGEPVAGFNAEAQRTQRRAEPERVSNSLRLSAFSASLRSFPCAARIAGLTEKDLRDCKMGFRAPYLLGTARAVASGKIDLESLRGLSLVGSSAFTRPGVGRAVNRLKAELQTGDVRGLRLDAARAQLLELPGVGRKIADCVLLFGYGFDGAFPVDVWVMRALQQLYFPKRRASAQRIEKFAATHFGPHAGYAQQYLFHYMRTKKPQTLAR